MITEKNWRKFPLDLVGETVDLISLDKNHIDELTELGGNKNIWTFYAVDGSNKMKLKENLETALEEREKGIQYPFVVFDKTQGKMIGSTRFLDVQPQHRKLEIGWTWLIPDYWGTNTNTEIKMLLLTHCFETLKTIRVQLKTDENNIRSRKAIEKIGGKFEGILRNDMIRENNTTRNSAYYSITDDDWKITKSHLIKLIKVKP